MQHEAAWLRRLAERIIDDPSVAEDACQEAWLVASTRGLSNIAQLRPALSRWMRRSAWRRRRAELRRSAHEEAAEQRHTYPSPEEVLSRAEERQRLWKRVTELPEPYCMALLLRFQEELTPNAIAERVGCPADTVRGRIRRGLVMLRERYERGEGGIDMRSLALVATPLTPHLSVASAKAASVGAPSATAALGAITMNKTTTTLLSATVLLAGGAGVWELSTESSKPTSSTPKVEASSASLPYNRTEETPEEPSGDSGSTQLEGSTPETRPTDTPTETSENEQLFSASQAQNITEPSNWWNPSARLREHAPEYVLYVSHILDDLRYAALEVRDVPKARGLALMVRIEREAVRFDELLRDTEDLPQALVSINIRAQALGKTLEMLGNSLDHLPDILPPLPGEPDPGDFLMFDAVPSDSEYAAFYHHLLDLHPEK